MDEILKGMIRWPTAIYTSSGRALALISLLGCVLGITMTLHSWFSFRLLPAFDDLLGGLRYAAHLVVDWTFFIWFAKAISAGFYAVMLLLSAFLPIVPSFPDCRVPAVLKDLSILSLIIVRAFGVAYTIVPLDERDGARSATSEAQTSAMRQAQGKLVAQVHSLVDASNKKLYDAAELVAKLITKPWIWAGYDPRGTIVTNINRAIMEFVPGILMAGYLRVIGYLCVSRAWSVGSPFVITSRRTFVYFIPSITAAAVVACTFLLLNEFACKLPRDELPNALARWLGACREIK